MDIDGSNDSGHVAEVDDVLVAPPAPEQPKRVWAKAGIAIVAVAALGFGALSLVDTGSELDTSVADSANEEPEIEEPELSNADSEDSRNSDDESESTEEGDAATFADGDFAVESSMDIDFGGGGDSPAIFDGERFVSLTTTTGSDWLLRTSTDGLVWDETPTTGLPPQTNVRDLKFHDGTLVVIATEYSDRGSTSHIATSANGTSWTLTQLTESNESTESHVSATVVLDGQIVAFRTLFETGQDPEQLLGDMGLLNDEEGLHLCDVQFDGDGGPITVYACDYSEFEEEFEEPDQSLLDELEARWNAASSDEERAAVEEELEALWGGTGPEQILIGTFSPGDDAYDELVTAFGGDSPGEDDMRTEILVGPLTGPFGVVGELPGSGYLNNVVEVDGALFAHLESFEESTGRSNSTILTSTDGTTWTEAGTAPGDGGRLVAAGESLLFIGYGELGRSILQSNDGGATWAPSSLETSLFHSHTEFVSGDAGVVAFTSGQIEEFNDAGFEQPQDNPVLEVDGYTLTLPVFGGPLILTGPGGEVIHELNEEEAYEEDSNAVRSNPISGDMTFLDPDTGEDLVTFTEEAQQEAYESMYDGDEEEVYEEPDFGFEAHFSVDGRTWQPLATDALAEFGPNTHVMPVAIGDDELIVASVTYNETPEELFAFDIEGREPTEAEIQALEQSQSELVEYFRIEL